LRCRAASRGGWCLARVALPTNEIPFGDVIGVIYEDKSGEGKNLERASEKIRPPPPEAVRRAQASTISRVTPTTVSQADPRQPAVVSAVPKMNPSGTRPETTADYNAVKAAAAAKAAAPVPASLIRGPTPVTAAPSLFPQSAAAAKAPAMGSNQSSYLTPTDSKTSSNGGSGLLPPKNLDVPQIQPSLLPPTTPSARRQWTAPKSGGNLRDPAV